MEDVPHLLGAAVGDFNTDMRLICREGRTESFLLTRGELVARGAQKKPDLIEGIPLAPAVTGRVLLDAAAHLTWGITGELDDVKASSTLVASWSWLGDGVLISPEGIQPPIRTPARKSSPRSASQFSCTVPDLPGTRSNKWAVGWSFPRVVHDAGEFTWAPAASVLVVPYVLIDPQYPNPCETGRIIRCGLQTRLDMGPHGISRSCQLSSQSCNGGSLEAQLSDRPRPADAPGEHRPSGSTQ